MQIQFALDVKQRPDVTCINGHTEILGEPTNTLVESYTTAEESDINVGSHLVNAKVKKSTQLD